MANQYINKVVNGETGDVLIDLSGDSLLNASQLASGVTAHTRSGAPVTGTNANDMDTSTFNATASQILSGATAGVQGSKVTGTMTNNGAVAGTIGAKNGSYTVPVGYHDGSGKVTLTNVSALTPGNLKSGVNVLGIVGEYSGEAASLQSKSVTPSFSSQTVTADSGYDALSQVTVAAIPYSETDNSAGGKTATFGASA